ncbi:MAG: hypothetical protein HY260_04755 [Chloroflexi bacterium]|nr:hypothetical protein [Chloroflexota bacterium]
MTNELRTPEDYELFIYSLIEQFPSIKRSTIAFIRRGRTLARVAGELYFEQDVRLVVRQRIIYERLGAVIDEYGYEIRRGEEKLGWYDPQPHPDDPTLQSTYPHHKHVPPDIKHNRVPAPDMSFTRPNLPALIREIDDLLRKQADESRSGR